MSRSRTLTVLGGGVVVAALAATVGYFVLRQGDASAAATDVVSDPAEAAVPVEVVEATTSWVARTLSSSSTVEAEQSAQVMAKAMGVVTHVAVREGMLVEKDQILATIDDEEKNLALEKAVLTLKKVEAELNRAKLSFDQKLISRFDYEKATFERDLAQSELESAKLQLRNTVVRAPFAGRVTAKEIVVGSTIGGEMGQGDSHLFTLADFNSLVVKLFLPEKDVFQLEPGQPVQLIPEALVGTKTNDDIAFAGRVRDISPVVDPKTGTVKVTVAVIDRSANVRPGAFVRAEIQTDRREGAVLVPKIAVAKEGGRDFLFVATKGVAEKRVVELGYTRGGAIEVVSGIESGEHVIVAGHTALEDGETVDVLIR